MERVPFAMRAMAKAAVDAGLIDGSKTAQEREAALFKLMEQGKLISGDVLPHFGKAMSELANNNDELAKALRENLAPALGRAGNHLVDLQTKMYEGMKPSVMFALDGFSDLAKEANNAAYFTGTVLGGALFGLTTIIRLPVAALTDLAYWISDVTGLSDESTKHLLSWTGTLIGAASGVWVLVKAVKGLIKGYLLAKRAKEAFENFGKGDKNKTTGGKPPKGDRDAPQTGDKPSKGRKLASLGGKILTATFLYPIVDEVLTSMIGDTDFAKWAKSTTLGDLFTAPKMDTGNMYPYGQSSMYKGYNPYAQPQSVKVDINVNPNGLDDVIEAKVEKSNGDMLEGAAMNLSSGSIK